MEKGFINSFERTTDLVPTFKKNIVHLLTIKVTGSNGLNPQPVINCHEHHAYLEVLEVCRTRLRRSDDGRSPPAPRSSATACI